MGQLLSIPFILLGIFFLVWAAKKRIPARAVHPEPVKTKKEATHFAKPLSK
jgi:prolipoprotein diacylglyceryltransferase